MIEVEKKFQPTEGQIRVFLADAEFVGKKIIEDIYYDLPDFSFFKGGMRLRKRNGIFELKIEIPNSEKTRASQREEITDESEILARLGFNGNENLEQIVVQKMGIFATIRTTRREYRKGEFIIDIDETDFGYSVCEIELTIEDTAKREEAEEKIIELARSFGFSSKKLPGKIKEYIRRVKPKLFQELFGELPKDFKTPKIH